MQLCGQYGHPALAVKVSFLDWSDVLVLAYRSSWTSSEQSEPVNAMKTSLWAPHSFYFFALRRAFSLVHVQQSWKRGTAHSLNVNENKDYHGDPFDIVWVSCATHSLNNVLFRFKHDFEWRRCSCLKQFWQNLWLLAVHAVYVVSRGDEIYPVRQKQS